MSEKTNKGAVAEEALRDYFSGQGFYTIRGAKVVFQGYDVTDIDIFIYARPSSFTRERGSVDIKNKKTPQAFERILWAKGLSDILGLDRCFVATTDHRSEVVSFGTQNKVTVLDGLFLARLPKSRSENDASRLSEEEFLTNLEVASVGKLGGDWKGGYEKSKSRVVSSSNFDGANSCLDDIRLAMEILAGASNDPTSRRLAYVFISHYLLILDYLSTSLPLLDFDGRKAFFEDGFRYGDRGKRRAEEILAITSTLATALGGRYKNFGSTLRDEMLSQYAAIPVEILAEFFARSATLRTIFDLAISFEYHAFSRECTSTGSLPADLQSVIALLSDYFKIDRKLVLF